MSTLLAFRETLSKDDLKIIRKMVAGTGVFSAEEIDVAVELAEDALKHATESDYHFILADEDNKLIGYTCFGRIPFTAERYDLYWIVVDKATQARGVASELMKKTEAAIRALGGKKLYAETSSRAVYAPAQAFYRKHGMKELACLKDFYADGDNKLTFGKNL